MMATGGFRSRVRVASLIAVIALVLAGAGCNGGTDDRLPPAQTPTPTPSPTPTLDPEDAAAFAVLEGYIDAVVATLTESSSEDALSEYTTDNRLDHVASQVQANRREGRIYAGNIEISAMEVVERHLEATEPHIIVQGCLDGGDWRLVDRDSGQLIGADPHDHQSRHLALFELSAMDGGRWLVSAPRLLPQWYVGVPEEDLETC